MRMQRRGVGPYLRSDPASAHDSIALPHRQLHRGSRSFGRVLNPRIRVQDSCGEDVSPCGERRRAVKGALDYGSRHLRIRLRIKCHDGH